MKKLATTPLSVLDLVSYPDGKTIADGLQATRDLAQKAETWGYKRYWMAEHHNMEGVASAATSVIIGFVAENTSKIRVGSGGIMLPNHAPLVIAEQFGTLESLYPGRIDLGLGRAPGGDPHVMRAFRKDVAARSVDFGELVDELLYYFAPPSPGQKLRAIPGAGLDIPIWILGSSLYSAHLAARLGRPYAFAGHFAPAEMLEAFEIYRAEFQPSAVLKEPYTMTGVSVVAAPTDDEAEYLATSVYQRILRLIRGEGPRSAPPVKSMDALWSPPEEVHVRSRTRTMVVGGPETVARGLQGLIDATQADELIITSDLFEHAHRLRSYEIMARVAASGK